MLTGPDITGIMVDYSNVMHWIMNLFIIYHSNVPRDSPPVDYQLSVIEEVASLLILFGFLGAGG